MRVWSGRLGFDKDLAIILFAGRPFQFNNIINFDQNHSKPDLIMSNIFIIQPND